MRWSTHATTESGAREILSPARTVVTVFVRVVERPVPGSGSATLWWLETPGSGGPSLSFSSRAQAVDAARSRGPEWLEVGEVIPAAGTASRHHRWTTFRRAASGEYQPSALGWAAGPSLGEGGPDQRQS